MGMTVTLTAGDPAATTVAVLDGTGTDPWKLITADFGNTAWSTGFSGPRGTQGARAASSTPENRTVQLLFRASAPASFTDAATRASQLAECLELVRRYGGRLTVRHTNQGYRHHFRVLAGTASSGSWSNSAERGKLTAGLTFVCAPYVDGDSMGIDDQFTTNTIADYTADSGSLANVTITGGQLKSTATGTVHAIIHTATGHLYGDAQAMVRVVPAVIANHRGGGIVKRISANSYLCAYVQDDGAASTLRIDRVAAGVATNLASTALTRITAGQAYHVACRLEGNTIHAEYWAPGTPPNLAAAATTATSATMSGTPTYMEGTTGQCGLYLRPANAADAVEVLQVTPYTYRGANLGGPITLPGHIRLDGAIPGDAPATCTVDVGVVPESTDTTAFGMVGWARRPVTWNLVPDAGFDWYSAALARQWSVAAVAGVTGAATSITQTTGGRFGVRCASVVTPATANTGCTCELIPPGGFRPGVTYTAELWVRSAAGTTNSRLRLGVSGDIASETAAALTSGWVRRTVTWTPTALRTQAYLAFEVTAATATTILIDGASVYEGTTAPTLASQREGNSGLPPFGVLEAQAAASISGFATGTGAAYLNGRRLVVSAGLAATAEWVVDPALLPTDMHADSMDVEVWAAVENGTTGLSVVTSAQSLSSAGLGQTTYTREYGATGRTSVPAVNGLVRLGTLPLVPANGVAVPQRIVTAWAWSVVNTGLTLNYLLLMNPAQRQASPTGKATTNYPTFANTASSRPITRRVLPDGRGQASGALSGVWAQAPAMIGPLLEPDATNVDFVATVARKIPDTAGGAVLALFRNGGVSIIPTPRWHIVRDV